MTTGWRRWIDRLALGWFLTIAFSTLAMAAGKPTVRIVYPTENEQIQQGEACKLTIASDNGWFWGAERVEYFLTEPGQAEKLMHTAVGDYNAAFTFPPLKQAGPHTLRVRVTEKGGAVSEDAVRVQVGGGQYKFWPAYDYTELADLKKITPEPWVEHDHVKDGWDWSLPGFVTPSPRSALALERRFSLKGRFKKPEYQFPVNDVGSLWIRWRDLEPVEGQFDFSALEEVLRDAKSKGVNVALRILFSRRGKITGQDENGHPVFDTSRAFAPDWLADKGIKLIEYANGEFESGEVDYDPLDPIFHSYYTRLVKKLGESDVPDLLAYAYVGYASKSNGDEYIGPEVPKGEDPAAVYPVVKERLDAWAEAFKGQTHKVYMAGPSQYGFDLGFGVRRGFVEKYLYEIPDETLGSTIDEKGYLVLDETVPLHAGQLFNGEENEEYEKAWLTEERDFRFGYTPASFSYRYFMASLRMLQMRCNFVLTGPGHLIKGMLPFVSQQLGRTVEDAPDVWALLNTGYIRTSYYQSNDYQNPPRALTAAEKENGFIESRNFERWLHQRDEPGYETEPRIKINQPHEMWMVPDEKPYDFIARAGKRIGFHIDDRWLEQNRDSRLAIKVTFIDTAEAKRVAECGTLVLNYQSQGEQFAVSVALSGGDQLRTATFFVENLEANAMEHGFDFTLEAGNCAPEIVVSMVRVVRADPSVTSPPTQPTI